MTQSAKVVEIMDDYAVIEVSRASMCDGCHKSCGTACPMAGIFGKGKTARARAKNVIGAAVGDTVTIETEASGVLISAALLFIAPLVSAGAFYVIANYFVQNQTASAISAVAGFVGLFALLAIAEKRKRLREPKITITAFAENTTRS